MTITRDDKRWGVWTTLCRACGTKAVSVASRRTGWPRECGTCGEKALEQAPLRKRAGAVL